MKLDMSKLADIIRLYLYGGLGGPLGQLLTCSFLFND